MTRIFRSIGFVLALATAGLGLGAFAWTTGGPAAAQGGGFTPLPPGWELCILQGLSAPATAANVADLDEWQAAEGGSTNNTAAFNPYNTLRTTDNSGAALPGAATSANGFPAFSSWAAGCSATIATLFQPNMWVIDAALRAGNVSPPTAFLAVVDQSSWCAPSPGGVPCYVDAMEVSPGSLALDVPSSSALDVYKNVNTDLQAYQQAIASVTADENAIGVRDFALAATESEAVQARDKLGASSRALQGFAISEYVNSGLYSGAPLVSSGSTQPLGPNTPQTSDGVVAQQYLGVAANNLIDHNEVAEGAVKGAERHQSDAAKALAKAAVTLTTDEAAENQYLTQLIADVATLEHAGACATVTIVPPPTLTPAAGGTTSTTTTTVAPTTTTTTTTTIPPPPTTTTTTVPPTTTTTTTLPPDSLMPTTTTTTVPPTTTTTTTTTVPPTTTTTTLPSAALPATTNAPPAEAAGVAQLQGCIATFAPPAGA
jgi:hypothetical protein